MADAGWTKIRDRPHHVRVEMEAPCDKDDLQGETGTVVCTCGDRYRDGLSLNIFCDEHGQGNGCPIGSTALLACPRCTVQWMPGRGPETDNPVGYVACLDIRLARSHDEEADDEEAEDSFADQLYDLAIGGQYEWGSEPLINMRAKVQALFGADVDLDSDREPIEQIRQKISVTGMVAVVADCPVCEQTYVSATYNSS